MPSRPKYWATPYGKRGPPADYLSDRNVIPAPELLAIHNTGPNPQYWDVPAYTQPTRWQQWRNGKNLPPYYPGYGSPYGSPYADPSYYYPEPEVYPAAPTYTQAAAYAVPAAVPVAYASPVAYAPPLSYAAPPAVSYALPAAVPLGYGAPGIVPVEYGAPAYYY
eukprot:EG_transcript_32051